jgi:15-cis-phytoene synthase
VQDAHAHCEALVRAADRDRYLAGLFAPAAERRHLYALYAFASEVARVREAAREPLPGEIRLQWWRDALRGDARGEVAANPVAAALIDTIEQCALPKEPLIALIDAHGFDLYDEAMASLAELDVYVEHTAGTVFALGATILAGRGAARAAAEAALAADASASAAATRAGIAQGVTQRLRSFPRDVARQKLFVPLDVLKRHGVTREEVEARQDTAGLRAALAELRGHARAAFARFRAEAPSLPDACAPAFLNLAVVPALLARLDAADPFSEIEVPQWRRQWTLWRAARRWPMI